MSSALIAEFDENKKLIYRCGNTQWRDEDNFLKTTTVVAESHHSNKNPPGFSENYFYFLYRSHRISEAEYERKLNVLSSTKEPNTIKNSRKKRNVSLILYDKTSEVSVILHCIDKINPISTRYNLKDEILGENYQGGMRGLVKFGNITKDITTSKSANNRGEYVITSDDKDYELYCNATVGTYLSFNKDNSDQSFCVHSIAYFD